MIETLFTSCSGKGIKYTRQTEKFWSINQVIVAHDHVHICVYEHVCLCIVGYVYALLALSTCPQTKIFI